MPPSPSSPGRARTCSSLSWPRSRASSTGAARCCSCSIPKGRRACLNTSPIMGFRWYQVSWWTWSAACSVPVTAVATVTPQRQGGSEQEAKKARLVVFGDSDFASNNYLNLSGNRDLFLNTVSWLAEEENLIAIRPKESGQFFSPVTANQQQLIFWLSMLVVEATVKDGAAPSVLQIGARTPTMSGYYAREGEQPKVLMVATTLQTKFDKSVFSLRDKTVLSLEQAQVKRVEVHHGDQVIAAEAEGGQGWKLVAPLEAKADKAKIDELPSGIREAKAKEFVDETPQDLARYGLNPPQWRLAFFIGDDRAEKSLLLG